ncbi:MAG: ABC transporter substrate-binding protein [Dehalococcoidia bacterium]|nr:ABC transporter substrate-binding protein [Dehalococcoidia bacterium]
MGRRLGSLLAVVAVVAAACAPAPQTAPAQTGGAQQPQERRAANQTLRVAQIGLPATLSPESSAANIALYSAIYDSMVWVDGKFNVLPRAAERWTQPEPTTWRFTLRRDLTFSNGDRLTAADVEFTLNLIVETRMPQMSQLTNLVGAKMVDDYTVDVMTRVPDASVVPGLLYAWIMPRNYYRSVGKDGFAVKPIGSGPYELVEFRANDIAVFRKRPTEHPYRKPIITDLIIRSITEQTQMVSGLRTGELDVVQGLLSPDIVEQIARTDAKIEYRTTSNISALISQPEMRMRDTPLQDKRVRWALNYAVNNEAIANTLFKGYAIPSAQLSVPNSPGWNDDLKPVYDPAMARRLLAEAGYPNGFRLPVGIEFTPQTVNPNLAAALQADLRAVGIEAAVTPYELAAFLDKYYGRNNQVKGDLFVQSTGDTNGFMTHAQGLYSCNNALHWWCNPEFDRLMQLANAELDVAKRGELMRRAVRVLYDDVAHVHLIISSVFHITSSKVRGFVWDNPAFFTYDDVYKVE